MSEGQKDKFDEMENVEQSELVFINGKRTYDQYQTIDARIMQDAWTNSQQLHNIASQALQNAVAVANKDSLQATKHADIACDRQWNVDEQGYTAQAILQDEGVVDTLIAKILAKMAGDE